MSLVVFDGPNRLIVASSGTIVLDVRDDIYSPWKEWAASGDNLKFVPALRSTGGDPLPGGQALGAAYFLLNGWKIRPQEAHHTLSIVGNMYCEDGNSPFVPTLGAFNVSIVSQVSNLATQVFSSGSSTCELNVVSTSQAPQGSRGKDIQDIARAIRFLIANN